eukprot:6176200-Amphidinium_carterae.1
MYLLWGGGGHRVVASGVVGGCKRFGFRAQEGKVVFDGCVKVLGPVLQPQVGQSLAVMVDSAGGSLKLK